MKENSCSENEQIARKKNKITMREKWKLYTVTFARHSMSVQIKLWLLKQFKKQKFWNNQKTKWNQRQRKTWTWQEYKKKKKKTITLTTGFKEAWRPQCEKSISTAYRLLQ